MSVPVDTETMKVCEAADDKASSPKDNVATKSEATDQSQSSKDVHGSSNNKRDVQVKIDKNAFTLKSGAAFESIQSQQEAGMLFYIGVWFEFKFLNIHQHKNER